MTQFASVTNWRSSSKDTPNNARRHSLWSVRLETDTPIGNDMQSLDHHSRVPCPQDEGLLVAVEAGLGGKS
ncbi:MAG: hypothetical protein ACI82F_001143 [Planctomycetota bacterium]|jgi:hypothetical protein